MVISVPQIRLTCTDCRHQMTTFRIITVPQSVAFTCEKCERFQRYGVTAADLAKEFADEVTSEPSPKDPWT